MSNYNGKTAITFGVFDLLHFGHFELFRRIRELVGESGKVYVMLQIDEMIAKYKPGCKNVYDFATRQKMIETLRTVDKAIPYDVVGIDAVKDIEFDILVVGPELLIYLGINRVKKPSKTIKKVKLLKPKFWTLMLKKNALP